MRITIKIIYFIHIFLFYTNCSDTPPPKCNIIQTHPISSIKHIEKKDSINSSFRNLLLSNGFVSIKDIDSSILLNLKYNTVHNFTGINLYGNYETFYVFKNVADKLHNVQKELQSINSNYSLIIYDALRPLSIQKIMWDSCKLEGMAKRNFIASPTYKSLHNYGAAIDVSIALQGTELDMGTPFDYNGKEAYTYIEKQLLSEGKLTTEQYSNRKLLQNVMTKNGFIGNKYEWWHYNACYRSEVSRKYPLVVSFDSIQSLQVPQ